MVVPEAELSVGCLANTPASTSEGAYKCMSLKSELDVQLNIGTLHGGVCVTNSLCMNAALRTGGGEKRFRQSLSQPTRVVRARTSANLGMRAVERLVAGRLAD